jgi:hypothetical protein
MYWISSNRLLISGDGILLGYNRACCGRSGLGKSGAQTVDEKNKSNHIRLNDILFFEA